MSTYNLGQDLSLTKNKAINANLYAYARLRTELGALRRQDYNLSFEKQRLQEMVENLKGIEGSPLFNNPAISELFNESVNNLEYVSSDANAEAAKEQIKGDITTRETALVKVMKKLSEMGEPICDRSIHISSSGYQGMYIKDYFIQVDDLVRDVENELDKLLGNERYLAGTLNLEKDLVGEEGKRRLEVELRDTNRDLMIIGFSSVDEDKIMQFVDTLIEKSKQYLENEGINEKTERNWYEKHGLDIQFNMTHLIDQSIRQGKYPKMDQLGETQHPIFEVKAPEKHEQFNNWLNDTTWGSSIGRDVNGYAKASRISAQLFEAENREEFTASFDSLIKGIENSAEKNNDIALAR